MALNGVEFDITARDQNVAATIRGVNDALKSSASTAATSFGEVAGEIGRATAASNEYASAAAGIGSALMSGAGPIVALGLAHVAVQKIIGAFADAEKQEKAFADEGERHAGVIRDLIFETDQYVARMNGAAASDIWRATQLKKIDDEAYKQKEKLRDIEAQIYDAERLGATGKIPDLTKDREKELQRLAGLEENWVRERGRIEAEYLRRSNAEEAKAGEKAAQDRERRQEREDEAARRRAEQRAERDAATRGRDLILMYQESKRANAELERDEEKRSVLEGKRLVDQYQASKKLNEQIARDRAKTQREIDKEEKERERKIEQSTQRMVGSLTSGLAKVAEGQASFADVMISVAHTGESILLGMLDEYIAKQITAAIVGKATKKAEAMTEISANAGIAGAGAAASQAAIPIVGPMLAAAAMEQTSALVLSSMLPLASAKGGFYDIPSDQLVATHKREQILPAEYAEGLRQLIANGGGGGAPLIGTVIATNAESFGRDLQRHDSDLSKGLRKAQRRRRASRV